MLYYISRNSITSQYIRVRLTLACVQNETIHLQLPAWRPGRYELANYAQNLKGFKVKFQEEDFLWRKSSKDLWEFQTKSQGIYEVHYEYYCNKMDAGACWSDDRQLYLNFSNFIFEIQERKNEQIQLRLELEENFLVATSLPKVSEHFWGAENFQHLMDSPLLASLDLKHDSYKVGSSTFHMWFNGEIHFNLTDVKSIFQSFTKKQIEAFGDFPSRDYHFIIQLLPFKHYHGVEHRDSTVITFGPAESLKDKTQMDELVGVSSHELYHYWNVCRIRPKGILPYDLSKEVYLEEGLVMEGVTTYMGDHYLLKSGYFNLEEYLLILQKQIQKEFDSFGWQNQSIVQSSFDLWLDGYKAGIPEKKVSIYNRGALISLCLDQILTSSESTLEKVMKDMWIKFGKAEIGYCLKDFEELVILHSKDKVLMKSFFQNFVYGEIEILENFENNDLLHLFGIRKEESGIIIQLHPDSEAYTILMKNDRILEFGDNNTTANQVNLKIDRLGKILNIPLIKSQKMFFPKFTLMAKKNPKSTLNGLIGKA